MISFKRACLAVRIRPGYAAYRRADGVQSGRGEFLQAPARPGGVIPHSLSGTARSLLYLVQVQRNQFTEWCPRVYTDAWQEATGMSGVAVLRER